jgi:predicted metal-dependent phosphoesterase TrpH
MLIDLHVHTQRTPGGALRPLEVLRRARQAGLDGVVFTDLASWGDPAELSAAAAEAGLLALRGLEVATDRGRFLCYLPDPSSLAEPAQVFGGVTPWPAQPLLLEVAARGGVAVAAHPYDRSIGPPAADAVFTLDGLCALEGHHGRSRGGVNDLAVEAADHLNLPCVGGSGALASLDELGGVATLFRDTVRTEADLVAQLRAGTVHAVTLLATSPSAAACRSGTRPGDGRPARSTPRSRPAGRS